MNLKKINISKKKSINDQIYSLKTFLLNKKYHIELKQYKKKRLYLFELEIGFSKGRVILSNNELQLKEFEIKKTFKDHSKSNLYFNEYIEKKVIDYKVPKYSFISHFLKIIFSKNNKTSKLADINNALLVHKFYKKVYK